MKKLMFIASFLWIGLTSAFAQAEVNKESNPNAPVIKFEQQVIDYGTIEQGADGNRKFVFTNEGKEPLILTNVKASCGCTTPKWTRNPVAPGEKGEIMVHYDTKRMGPFHKNITITSNAKTPSVRVSIKGKVEPKQEVQTTPVKSNSSSKVSKK